MARETGYSRNTIRRVVRSDSPPIYRRQHPTESKLDPFKEEICHLLGHDSSLTALRIRELIEPLGYQGRQTAVNEYVREVRPIISPPRTYQRTTYVPGEICQFDLWEPAKRIPVGYGEMRRGFVVVALLGYSRVGTGALIFSKQTADVVWGIAQCLRDLGGAPKTLVWDRESAVHKGGGRPTDEYAALLGSVRSGWHFCAPRDPEAKGAVERLQGYLETNFEKGRSFASEGDFRLQLADWFSSKANVRMHRTLRARPVDRLPEDRKHMAPLPQEMPSQDIHMTMRVPADPYARYDTNDYSLDPRFVGQRCEVRISQFEVTAKALDTGCAVARHTRVFARHRTITDPDHAEALRALRRERLDGGTEVEERSLAHYDRFIPS